MGHSYSSAADLSARSAYRNAATTDPSLRSFAYTAKMASAPPAARKVHESVDPRRIDTLGRKIRECADSIEHPNTLPVVVGFDQTGSMQEGPRIIQNKLNTLKGATLKAGLVDAQLAFGCWGDAQCHEAAPCQIGQFESGLEMEEWLNNLFLEGMGGANDGETSGLLLYFLGNFSRLDSFDKRGKKGYIFLVGDEKPMPYVTRQEIKTYIDEDVQGDFTIEQVVAKVKEMYDVFFLLVNNSTAKSQHSHERWSKLLGDDYVFPVEDLNNISEQIAIILARAEDMVDSVDAAVDLLVDAGADRANAEKASKAVAVIDKRTKVATTSTSVGTLPDADDASTTRL